MAEFVQNLGLPGLFLLSFLAASILPLGSEWLLIALVLEGYGVGETVLVASVGNYLGACTTYCIGFFGSVFFLEHVLKISEKNQERARVLYRKYGVYSLLLSWVPIVGDPLCFVGGIQRLNFWYFSVLVFAGKLARYAVIGKISAATMTVI